MTFDLGIRKPLAKPEGWQPTFKNALKWHESTRPARVLHVYIGRRSQDKLMKRQPSVISDKEQW